MRRVWVIVEAWNGPLVAIGEQLAGRGDDGPYCAVGPVRFRPENGALNAKGNGGRALWAESAPSVGAGLGPLRPGLGRREGIDVFLDHTGLGCL